MKIFEVAGEGKLHGLTVMSLDAFVNKEDDVEESQVTEIDRRGFLKGLGAAAVAGVGLGTANGAMAQSQGPGYWANQAANLAEKSIKGFHITGLALSNIGGNYHQGKSQLPKFKDYIFTEIHKLVSIYCEKTNCFNIKSVINDANAEALKMSGLDSVLVTEGASKKFVISYKAVLLDKVQEWSSGSKQQTSGQQQEQLVTVYVDSDKKVGDIIARKSDGVRAQIVKIIGPHNEPGKKPVKTLAKIIESVNQGVSESLNERASQLLSAEDRNGVITVVVQAPDGTKRSLANENPRYINQWLQMKYGLTLPRNIMAKFAESDMSGVMHAAKHYNKSFLITAELAEGGKKTFRVKAQSERVAREKFEQHHNQATIISVKAEGVAEGLNETQFKSKEEAVKYAKERVKTLRDKEDGIEVWAMPNGSFDVNHTMNSSGRNHIIDNGGKKVGTVRP